MVNREAIRIWQAALDAIQRTGGRAIILSGWGSWQPGTPPDGTLFLESAPHDWLFPRCRAVVHHGGAGTTAASLRAGVPSIVIPHAADQPFWGSRGSASEARPDPIRQRANEVGDLIRAEYSVGQAVSLIEKHASYYYDR
jgi:sterol 3beta-glucosyltransferase